jgi:hypothetical protein
VWRGPSRRPRSSSSSSVLCFNVGFSCARGRGRLSTLACRTPPPSRPPGSAPADASQSQQLTALYHMYTVQLVVMPARFIQAAPSRLRDHQPLEFIETDPLVAIQVLCSAAQAHNSGGQSAAAGHSGGARVVVAERHVCVTRVRVCVTHDFFDQLFNLLVCDGLPHFFQDNLDFACPVGTWSGRYNCVSHPGSGLCVAVSAPQPHVHARARAAAAAATAGNG